MNAPTARSLIACAREVGSECPYCASEIALGDPIMVCQACGMVHHRNCWRTHERCGAYSCVPARRAVPEAESVLAISQADLENAVPLPTRRPAGVTIGNTTFVPRRPESTLTGRNRLAVASLLTALGGIVFVGAITGLVAIVLGSLALGSIRGTQQKGLGFAVSGVLLGLVDMVVWMLALGWFVSSQGGAEADLRFIDAPPDPASLQKLAPELRRAMRANVLIERNETLGMAMGSGVILGVDRGEALIVTNRHVVDPHFNPNKSGADPARLGLLDVQMIGQSKRSGRVVWMAPDGIDLALVRVPCPPGIESEAALWEKARATQVGESVFAIGNPQRLGWTHTQGVISQFRLQDIGQRAVKLIQTQAAINPGNSGGGLYSHDGYLIGINTWTSDKRTSEGISFAIALDTLLDLSPPDLLPALTKREPPEKLETP